MTTLNARDFPTIDAALDAAETIGADVGFDEGIHVTAGLRLRDGVRLVASGNACLQWAGGPGTVLGSAAEGVLKDAGIIGLDIDARDADTVIGWRSAVQCVLRDVAVASDNPAAVVLDIDCNATGPQNRWGNYNSAYNRIDNLVQTGRCGSLVRLAGYDDGNGAPKAVTTLNSFSGVQAAGVCGTGIDFARWCDSNQFDGVCELYLIADGATGVAYNTAAPDQNVGVYANHFAHLAVDSFGVMQGRVGLRLNRCHSIRIGHYANGPAAEGGQYVISPLAHGFDIRLLREAGGYDPITREWIDGYLFAFADAAGANQLVIDKHGHTIQRGIAQVGFGAGGEPVGLEIGNGRTAAGYAYVDFVSDPAWPDYGLRMIGGPGANGNAWLYHRGGGDLILQAQDGAGRVVLAGSDGVPRIAVSKDGVRFNNKPAPRVVGGLTQDAVLRSAMAQLGIITNV
jgi:hypothetical protein